MADIKPANFQAGWSTFGYICYTIKPSDTPPFHSTLNDLDELLGVESYLRRQRHIAYADLTTKILWAFEAEEGSGSFSKGVPDLDQISKLTRLEGVSLDFKCAF